MDTERKPWDRQAGETENAYRAFEDYRDMGKRSLRDLQARYVALSSDSSQTIKPPTKMWSTLSTWSAKYHWQERVAAWDNFLTAERQAAMLHKRTQVEDDDFADYERELETWRKAYDRTRLHLQRHEDTITDPTSNERIRLIFVEMDINSFETLSRWRDRISKRGRRAVGLPETITQSKQEHTGENGTPIQMVVEEGWRTEAVRKIRADDPQHSFKILAGGLGYKTAKELYVAAGKAIPDAD